MSLNVGTELPIVKKMDMFFRAQFQTQTCFETARAVWIISGLVLMVAYGRKWCHFRVKGICGPKVQIIEESV